MNSEKLPALQAEDTSCGIVERADKLRAFASDKIKRKDWATLYRVLAETMALCEMGPENVELLRQQYAQKPALGSVNRQFIEKGSDSFQVCCRYVFYGAPHGVLNRYAITLREAAKRQIRSDTLAVWLTENGGVNALFLSRPLAARTVMTKCLRLDKSISAPKGEAFSIRLLRLADGTFQVLSLTP